MEQHVGAAEFDEVIGSSEGLVMVDFWAPWCGPCKQMNPVLDELSAEWGDQVTIVKVNIDEEADLARRFGVMSIPSFVFLREGHEVSRLVGARSAVAMRSLVASQL